MNLDQNWFLETISGKRKSVTAAVTRLILYPLSLVYRLVICIRNWAYDLGLKSIHRVNVPVISVGNLTTGGTGKTPFVIWLANHLSENHSVTVLSRGYGSVDGKLNDEGREIALCCPGIDQIQNPDRVAAAKSLSQSNHSVIILDDGFQHRRIHRDLDIVLIDALNPFGHGFQLPRGLLREPVSSIRRCDLVLLTRSNLVSHETKLEIRNRLSSSFQDLSWAEAQLFVTGWRSITGEQYEVDKLADQGLFVFSAIGNPFSFEETLRRQEMNVVGGRMFKDHHRFTQQDLNLVELEAKTANANAIVCTMKDFVKIPEDYDSELPLFALVTEMQIVEGADLISQKVDAALAKLKDAR